MITYNATFSFADFADFPAPKVWELGDAVAEIPHLWKEVGLGLGLSPGHLRGIQENTAGQVRQAQKCFTEVFISWKDGRMSPYTWEMLVSVLLQRRLATDTRQLVTDLHNTLSDRYARIRWELCLFSVFRYQFIHIWLFRTRTMDVNIPCK